MTWLSNARLTTGAKIGIAIILVNILTVLFAPVLAPYGEAELVGGVWSPPSGESLLGLDNLGRDLLSRLIYGGRTSISLALIATLLSFSIGIAGGLLAAVASPWIDTILSRLVDTVMSVPQLILALMVLSVFGTSISVLIMTIAVLDSTRVFRLSRAIAQELVVLPYIEVARLRGDGLWWVVFREVLPNALSPLAAEFGLRFSFALLFMASLSFLGIGVQPPAADWGSMVRENSMAINFGSLAPLLPAAAIAVVTIGVNLVVDWFLSNYGRAHSEGK